VWWRRSRRRAERRSWAPATFPSAPPAEALLAAAVEHFGGLHILVNNAGVLRDRMLFSMSDEEWDTVIRVHLRGHFLLSRGAAAHWRQ
jgi:3-oxoacyl-[acyl-carrier protein] reductase